MLRIAGPVRTPPSFAPGSAVTAPVRQVRQPDEHRAEERADHLRRDVAGHVGPGEAADRRQRDRHRRIEVRAADAADGVDGHRHRDAPAGGDDDPAAVLPLGSFEHDVGDDAVAEQDEHHRADGFREKGLHAAAV